MNVISKMSVKSAQISAKIIRADGSVEELGVVSYWHKNPVKRLWFRFRKFIGV